MSAGLSTQLCLCSWYCIAVNFVMVTRSKFMCLWNICWYDSQKMYSLVCLSTMLQGEYKQYTLIILIETGVCWCFLKVSANKFTNQNWFLHRVTATAVCPLYSSKKTLHFVYFDASQKCFLGCTRGAEGSRQARLGSVDNVCTIRQKISISTCADREEFDLSLWEGKESELRADKT